MFGVTRKLLRAFRYLQEVGYSDTILDVRSQRVRALLGNNYDINKATDNRNNITNGNTATDEQRCVVHRSICVCSNALVG